MNCEKALSQPQKDWAEEVSPDSPKQPPATANPTPKKKKKKSSWVERFNVQEDLSPSAFASCHFKRLVTLACGTEQPGHPIISHHVCLCFNTKESLLLCYLL